MKKTLLAILALQGGMLALPLTAPAQVMTIPAATEAEKEAFYAKTIENRVLDILKVVNLADADKSNAVHEILVAHYHDLRVRDAAIDTRLRVDGKDVNYTNRAAQVALQFQPLHDQFLAKLSAVLTADQVVSIKDLMTYNKVKFTYDAYCNIVPGLTDPEKAKILESLKAAREEAMEGGGSPEKAAIFQKYKDQINTYLDAQGHDTAKALKDYAAQHPNTNSAAIK